MRIHRRHRDDAAASLLEHDRRNRANVVEAALEIDRDRIVELALRDLENALRHRFAGVVEEEVDAPRLRLDRAGDFLCALKSGGVRFERHDLPSHVADLGCGPLHFRHEEIDERDVVARTSKRVRTGTADATGSPGDDRHLPHGHILHLEYRIASSSTRDCCERAKVFAHATAGFC
jgi:hypothetical protein